jgi:molybdopterin synthase sulfur carrier subunit
MSEPVRIIYLGKLADAAGSSGSRLDFHGGPIDWPYLVDALEQVAAGLGATVSDERVKVALNGRVLTDKTALVANAGDEIALLPPVSGG